MQQRARKTFAVLLLLGFGQILAAVPAGAHSGDQSYVYVDYLVDRVEGRVEHLASDLNEVLDLGLTDDEDIALEELETHRAAIEAFTTEHFSIGLGDEEQTQITYEEFEYLELEQGSYVVLHYTTGPLGERPPRTFNVSYDAFLETNTNDSAILLVGRDWENGILNEESNELRVFSSDNNNFLITLDEGSWFTGISSVIGLGFEHIRTGADHVMFIMALLLPSALIFRSSSWRPAPTFGASLLRVLKVATAFTVAHSITLSLAALEVVSVDSKIVESIIAISIILAALHNLRPVFTNREWVLAFGFGLVHGLGFARLLGELGLGRDQTIWTLLGFNIGVELGQAAIILMTFPALFLLRRTRYYGWLLRIGSIVLALIAFGWAVERIFELEGRIDELFVPLLWYPRVVFLMLGATVVAGALHLFEKSRNRLLPVTGADPDATTDELGYGDPTEPAEREFSTTS